jgi:hypothetical protein
MPKKPSTTLIPWQEVPLGGALQPGSMTNSSLSDWLALPADAEQWTLPDNLVLYWPSQDETTDGKVNFVTPIDIGAPTVAHVPEDALKRMMCFYVVGKLSGKALNDACHTLAEIFEWQREQAEIIPNLPSEIRRAASRVRSVERVPFSFDPE